SGTSQGRPPSEPLRNTRRGGTSKGRPPSGTSKGRSTSRAYQGRQGDETCARRATKIAYRRGRSRRMGVRRRGDLSSEAVTRERGTALASGQRSGREAEDARTRRFENAAVGGFLRPCAPCSPLIMPPVASIRSLASW